MLRRLIAGFATALLFCTATAHATDYKLTFSASDFYGPSSQAAPGPISGSITFWDDSFDVEAPVVKDVDLTIDGHTYTPQELTADATRSMYMFGAAQQLLPGTNDFQIFYSGSFFFFAFTSVTRDSPWFANTATAELTLAPAVVPEPETYALLLGGLGLLGVVARRRRG